MGKVQLLFEKGEPHRAADLTASSASGGKRNNQLGVKRSGFSAGFSGKRENVAAACERV
jgi:hypothetical protein